MGEILLGRHRVHNLTDLFQFPGDLRGSDSTLDLKNMGSPFQLVFSLFLIDITRVDRYAE